MFAGRTPFQIWYGVCSLIQSTLDDRIEAQSKHWITHFTNGSLKQRTESILHQQIHQSANEENA